MTRHVRSIALPLLACAALASLACSEQKAKPENNLGAVSLKIRLSDGVEIDTIRYSITGTGFAPIEGNIPVSAPGSTVSAFIEAIPAGVGHALELAAVSRDLGTVCLGEATFDVAAGRTTFLSLVMNCHADSAAGSLEVSATLNNCPQLTSIVVAPLSVAVGSEIPVAAAGADLDPADTLTFAWTASGGGSFAAPAQASTAFTCATAGDHVLTVTVSDGRCGASRSVNVSCVAP